MSDNDHTHDHDDARAGTHEDEDFAAAWEHRDEHDVGADTEKFEAFRSEDDTGEHLRDEVHGTDATSSGSPSSTSPGTTVLLGLAALAVIVIAIVYALG